MRRVRRNNLVRYPLWDNPYDLKFACCITVRQHLFVLTV